MPRNYANRESGLSKRISSWFKSKRDESLSFGAILNKYCEHGMSRRFVAKFLMDMKGEDGSTMGTVVSIKDTSLWEAWKSEVAQGRCSFVFKSKFKGNQFHGNRGKTRTLRTKHKHMAMLSIKYTCQCGESITKISPVGRAPRYIMGLKAHQCPHCNQYETSTGTFGFDGIMYSKSIIENKETFLK